MPTGQERLNRAGARLIQITLFLILAMQLGGCTTLDPEKNKLRAKFLPRWETNEVPFEEARFDEKIGRNIRDGFIGMIDDMFQGLFAVFTISPTTGFIVQKISTMVGDGIGLLDDNDYSEHIFKGIISRQFLKFGAQARDFTSTMGQIHGITINAPEHGVLDYVGDEAFHTKAYGAPSALTTLFGVVTADFLIRPAGHFIMIFGLRDAAGKIDETGLKLVEACTKIPFL